MTPCPKCGENIEEALIRDFWSAPWNYFDFPCPYCRTMLDVEVKSKSVFLPTIKNS